MNDQRCPKCHRLQSQHPGMKFASRDLNCRCMDCVRGHTIAGARAVMTPVSVDVKAQKAVRTPSGPNRSERG